MPARINASIVSLFADAGPIVATIFVRRGSTADMRPSVARGSAASELARGNAAQPGYSARVPSSSSIRSSWLYFATRSERAGAPVLI